MKEVFERFMAEIGQGFGAILIVLAIIMLFRGCAGAESLLPPIFPK